MCCGSAACPSPGLHLAYPKKFASAFVRKAQRASANVLASVDAPEREGGTKEPTSAVISDLSVAGASLEAPQAVGQVGDVIVIRATVTAGGIERGLSLTSVIRAIRPYEEQGNDNPRYRNGIEFQMLEPDDQLVLHGFVYEQIALGKAI